MLILRDAEGKAIKLSSYSWGRNRSEVTAFFVLHPHVKAAIARVNALEDSLKEARNYLANFELKSSYDSSMGVEKMETALNSLIEQNAKLTALAVEKSNAEVQPHPVEPEPPERKTEESQDEKDEAID